jgi:hypothetical protein
MMTELKDNLGEIKGEIFCLEVMYLVREDDTNQLLAYKALADPDTMYMHKTMKAPDRKHFIMAMEKEVADQSGNKNFLIIH